MQKIEDYGSHVAPKLPPRTHAVHLRNRLRNLLDNERLTVEMDQNPEECQSRKASSVGFVEIDDLMKFQEEYKTRSTSRLRSSLRHFFSTIPTEEPTSATCPESHINPMFAMHKNSLSKSFTHLPYPPKKKKRKCHLRRVFSCFSIFRN